jgi:hypothetical protein
MARSQLDLDTLKGAFVRQRYAESNVFGRADIEAWLDQQVVSGPATDEDWLYWRDTIVPHCTEFFTVPPSEYSGFLATHATSFRSIPSVNTFGFDYPLVLRNHVTFLRLGIRVYPMCRTSALIIVLSNPPSSKIVSCTGPDQLKYSDTVTAQDVLDAVLKSWRATNGNPLSKQILCELANQAVAQARSAAEADFDSAVAVSADGTEIICADLVMVWTGNGWVRYKPEAFRESKIVLDACLREATTLDCGQFRTQLPHFTAPNGNGFVFTRDVLHLRINRIVWQILIKTTDGKKVLLTTSEFCPDPLPEGGIPIT